MIEQKTERKMYYLKYIVTTFDKYSNSGTRKNKQ